MSLVILLASSRPLYADDLVNAVRKQLERYQAKLAELANWCDQEGLTQEAQRTRQWLRPAAEDRLLIPILPQKIGFDVPPENASPKQVEWLKRWADLRREQADTLFTLARSAVRQGRAGLGLDLAMAALHENPDHEALRRIFGYQKHSGFWRTRYEVQRLRAGDVWHDTFGWLPKAHLARYEKGERSFNGRWISAEEDAKLHADIRHGWVVETEHYRVLTNHSLQEGVALGKKMEQLNELWRRLFVRFYATEAEVLAMFDARANTPRRPPRQHRVVLFRNREEYLAALSPIMPGIEVSCGFYYGRTRTCYFFAGPGFDPTTAYHEAAHQLFQEVAQPPRMPGNEANFWIVEAAAMYLETLRQEGDFLILGGIDTPRVLAARVRFLQDHFYIPLREFVAMGMEDFQKDQRIAALYTQAAGLMQFFMHYRSGVYRDATVTYLASVYACTDTTDTLSRVTRTAYSALDEQYAEYMKSLPPLPPMRVLDN